MTWPNWSSARYVAPASSDLHIGLIDLPTVADGVSARPGSVGE
jgi:hypothetical protein